MLCVCALYAKLCTLVMVFYVLFRLSLFSNEWIWIIINNFIFKWTMYGMAISRPYRCVFFSAFHLAHLNSKQTLKSVREECLEPRKKYFSAQIFHFFVGKFLISFLFCSFYQLQIVIWFGVDFRTMCNCVVHFLFSTHTSPLSLISFMHRHNRMTVNSWENERFRHTICKYIDRHEPALSANLQFFWGLEYFWLENEMHMVDVHFLFAYVIR